MGKSVVNPVYAESSRLAYAKGGFVPHRKHQRYDKYDLLPDFVSQTGESWEHSGPSVSPIVKVEFLGTFLGYSHHGAEEVFRAHKVTLANGLRVPAYSKNDDRYNMCQHTGFMAY